ncbi:MAG: hypothetical protein JW873_01255 [Candidatus Saganbacteria bacterium]|nr:hypothetical protein [Candidatus Saganbacteria bacterium]
MLDGIIGAVGSNLPVNNNKANTNNATAAAGDVNFKNTFVELARASQIMVTDKGAKDGLQFNNWRELEDSLYYDKEEAEEQAVADYLKKLTRILKQKLG